MSQRHGLGFSLLEILIGLMLSSLILIALGQYMGSIKNQATHINDLFSEYADLRRITSMLRESTWQAGFTPCLNIDRLISLDRRTVSVALHALNLHDGININRMRPRFSQIISFDDPQSFTLQQSAGIMPGHAVIIADCVHAEVQSVLSIQKTISGVRVRVKNALAFTYKPPVYVGEWLEERFFVQKTSGHNSALFYESRHVDRLTDRVRALTAKIQLPLGRVLKITLALDQNRTLDLHARVRAL